MPIGAMTDGAKRRCPESSNISEEEEFQHVASSEEMPPSFPGSELRPTVFRLETKESGYSSKVFLPVGADSLEEWGRTICELPKVKGMSCSYHELTLQAAREMSRCQSICLGSAPTRALLLEPWTSRTIF
jgi:hypothetical protein